jgi:hypothetical protein
MYTKRHIEKILRINGLSLAASDDEIKSVLLYAKCEDIDTIISALRNEQTDADRDLCGASRPNTRCNVLLADERLKPETIRELLGVDVEVTFEDINVARRQRQQLSVVQVLSIFGWSALCASIAIGGIMWYYQIGVFAALAN